MKIREKVYLIICVILSLGIIVIGIFCFPNAICRLLESAGDFGYSMAYYFCEIFELPYNVSVTVNNYASWQIAESRFQKLELVDGGVEGLFLWFKTFGKLFISTDKMIDYLFVVSDKILYFSQWLIIIAPLILVGYLLFNVLIHAPNNDYNKNSLPLVIGKRAVDYVFRPVWLFIKDFFVFLNAHKMFKFAWILCWLFYFNFFTMIYEFLAFYYYLIISFDFVNIFKQLYKFLIDIAPMVRFVPLCIWIIVGILIFDAIRKRIGYKVLNHMENRNKGFINERPIVFMLVGSMGKKKTTIITDFALSQEVILKDKALELLFDNDLKFPNFPWINLENEIKQAMERHEVFNLATCKVFIDKKRDLWLKGEMDNKGIFDYDFKRYGLTYNDNLKISYIWDVIESYAKLYFIYVIECSLILSNYSIRSDLIMSDAGNFPLWDSDFFHRETELQTLNSRYAHILDFDSLRLGKKMLTDGKYENSFEFGVVNVTEIGKERGNSLELIDKKKKDEVANQKNDLFNYWLKMVRHSATVDNYPFIKVITDEQRAESLGADVRDLTEIVHIDKCNDKALAMPWFTWGDILYDFVLSKFETVYYDYRYNRGDNTLTMSILKAIVSCLRHYYVRIYNRFGYTTVHVNTERGTQDGISHKGKIYLMDQKIYANRFSTDCFSEFFLQKTLRSLYGLCDLPTYEDVKARLDELAKQNSYFIDDLIKGFNVCSD